MYDYWKIEKNGDLFKYNDHYVNSMVKCSTSPIFAIQTLTIPIIKGVSRKQYKTYDEKCIDAIKRIFENEKFYISLP